MARIFADYKMAVKEVSWTFSEDQLPQIGRHVNHKALLCVSEEGAQGKTASAFTKGVLWIRGGVVVHVPVLQEEHYVYPCGTGLESGTSSTLSDEAVLKQHVSGAGLYKEAASLT